MVSTESPTSVVQDFSEPLLECGIAAARALPAGGAKVPEIGWMAQMNPQKQTRLDGQLASARRDTARHRRRVAQLVLEAQQQREASNALVDDLRRQLAEADGALSALAGARRVNEGSARALKALRRERDALRADLNTGRVDIDVLRAQLAEGRSQQEPLSAELQMARQTQDQLEREVARLNGMCAEFEQALIAATESIGWRIANRMHVTQVGGRRLAWSGLRRCYYVLPLPRSLRWTARAAFFETFGFLLKGKPAQRSYEQARMLQQRLAGSMASPPPVPESGLTDYVFFGVIDWHLRYQRPQHIAAGMAARGHRVFYISPNFINAREPGAAIESLDDTGRLLSVRLQVSGSPVIYSEQGSPAQREQIRASLAGVLHDFSSKGIVCVLHHPFWTDLAETLPLRRMVYDCIDHHGGFSNTSQAMIDAESELIERSDLLVATAHWLRDRLSEEKDAASVALVPNACDYDYFCQRPDEVFADSEGRQVIGYIGAIADWFDVELIAAVARAYPECLVLLVGADTCGAEARLRRYENVQFEGEVSYDRLTHYVYGMDVCTIPFQVIPLTIATNPVKVFEYLAAGREVVSTALPEVAMLGDVAAIVAENHESFVQGVGTALKRVGRKKAVTARQRFAAENTWAQRVQSFDEHVGEMPRPGASVIIITYNGLDFTRRCVESILEHDDGCEIEIIFVDNDSHDETPSYLRKFCKGRDDADAVLNKDNRGFAAAVNQGMERARFENIVVMNNDTVVAPGWLSSMVRHVERDPSIGIIGPMTNNIGNEARIEMNYTDAADMGSEVRAHLLAHQGRRFELSVTAFFCVLIPRATYTALGGLDEIFGRGFFEDDDYCCRVREIGLKVVVAEDAFVHHELSASFGKLPTLEKQRLFEENRKHYEAKWGEWKPHEYR
ncbi:MAG: GT2 family glycosyltransferase/glycosyltransferase involved in cell wall biosynthesis [Pseudohongiellaceae bacterium]|jgi:GT2 family glycosyltransferase/glycosyltransferase involved in cell wall biosynthesis